MASKRNVRRKSCAGKRRYETAKEAGAAAYSARLRTSEWITSYGCRFCAGFHIGHTPAKVRQAIRSKAR